MSEGQPPPSQQQTQPKQQQNAQQQQVVPSQQQTPPQQQQAPPPQQQAPSPQQQAPPPQQQAPPPQQQAPPPQQQAPPPQQQVQPPQQQVHPQQQTQQQQQLQQQQHHQHHGQQQQVVQPQQQQTVAQQQQQHIQQAIPQQQIQQLQHIQPQQIQQTQHHVLGNMQPQTMTSVPLSMTMAPNPQNPVMAGAAASIRPQLPQLPQVQVIHQAMHSPPYLPQFSYNQQQQLMLQNMQAAMSMNPQFNMANMAVAMQGRPGTNMFTPAGTVAASPTTPTTPINLNASSGANTHMTTSMTTVPNQTKPAVANGNKQQQTQVQQQQQQQLHAQIGQVQQAQATAMIGGKPIILGQTTGQPLLSGQIGVISAGQLPTTQAYGAAGQAFGQIQSKAGQQLGVATNPAQAQLMTSQAPIRFSQQQLVSNAGQIISSQPVLSNQMLQAMASLQQQQYPGQMMSAPGQSPTIITGQGLYIRSANPVQAQGLMANVQAAINPTFKPNQQPVQAQGLMANVQAAINPTFKPNQQPVQNQSMPIQKQTTAAQTGKVLLPSATKVSTAKVAPTNSVSAMAKSMTSGATGKPKGRPKGSTTRPVSTSGVTAVTKTESISSVSKPSTPTIQMAALATPTDTKSQSDSELEVPKKQPANNIPAAITDQNEEQAPEIEEKPVDINDASKDNESLQESLPAAIIEQPVEKQRAIVKPHILTHVIEGFVIQEGPEPFPVQRSSLLTEFIPPKPGQPVEQSSLISMDEDDLDHEEDSSHSPGPIDGENSHSTLTCECCGRVELASKFHRSQRFCSTTCAKRYNIGCTRRLGLFPGKPKEKGAGGRVLKRKRHTKTRKDQRGGRSLSTGSLSHDLDNEEQSSSISGQEESVSPATTPDHRLHTPPPELHMETDQIPLTSPTKWNVQDVYEFIRSLPGCSPYADEFRSQEIDGQALLLLKEDHLMTAMNMKLGPALKICAKINAIKEETG